MKTSKLRVTVLCEWISPVTGEFPTQWARNVETQQIGVHAVTVCFICPRNIVFEHKITVCVDFVRMKYFPFVWLCFICASFEFTLDYTLPIVYVVIEHMVNSKWLK